MNEKVKRLATDNMKEDSRDIGYWNMNASGIYEDEDVQDTTIKEMREPTDEGTESPRDFIEETDGKELIEIGGDEESQKVVQRDNLKDSYLSARNP